MNQLMPPQNTPLPITGPEQTPHRMHPLAPTTRMRTKSKLTAYEKPEPMATYRQKTSHFELPEAHELLDEIHGSSNNPHTA